MKWYWAIFLTLAILSGMIALLQIGGAEAEWFIHFVVAIFGVWAAGRSASVGWGLFVFLLWPIGFPCFLISQSGKPSKAA